jgi:hypothetical protein
MNAQVRALAILLLFFQAFLQADGIGEPTLVSWTDTTVTKTGTVRAVGGSFVTLELNISAPQRTEWQIPVYSGGVVSDAEGNAFNSIKENSPPNPYSYSVSTLVRTSARSTQKLPPDYVVPEGYREYLLPSEGIE